MYGECHAHLIMDGINYKAAVSLHKNGVQDAVIHERFQAYQKAGISFIRDGGDALGVSARARELAGLYGIDYRTPLFAIHKNGFYGGIVGYGFDTLKEYADLVRQVVQKKGDFIKIMTSGILDFDKFGTVSTPLNDFQLVREMVHIAHQEGMAVMVHVNTPSQIRMALEAGCDSIEHGYYMDETCRKLFVKTGAIWVPTLATCANLRGSGRFEEKAVEQITNCHMENVRLALQEGVSLAAGSDAGAYRVFHAQGLIDEVHLLEEACQGNEALVRRLHQTLTRSQEQLMERFRRQ